MNHAYFSTFPQIAGQSGSTGADSTSSRGSGSQCNRCAKHLGSDRRAHVERYVQSGRRPGSFDAVLLLPVAPRRSPTAPNGCTDANSLLLADLPENSTALDENGWSDASWLPNQPSFE